MLNQINEGLGKDVLEAFGGSYPAEPRAALGDRITDETYGDILAAIEALVAGSGGGGTPPTVSNNLASSAVTPLPSNYNRVTSVGGSATYVLDNTRALGDFQTLINVSGSALTSNGAQFINDGLGGYGVGNLQNVTFVKISDNHWSTVAIADTND